MNGNFARGAVRGRNHRWKVLGVGFAANASFAAAFSGIPTTAVLLRGAYGIGNGGLGLVLGMLGLGIALSELRGGCSRTVGAIVACCCSDWAAPLRRSSAWRCSSYRRRAMCRRL